MSAEPARRAALVVAVDVGVDEADGQRLDAAAIAQGFVQLGVDVLLGFGFTLGLDGVDEVVDPLVGADVGPGVRLPRLEHLALLELLGVHPVFQAGSNRLVAQPIAKFAVYQHQAAPAQDA